MISIHGVEYLVTIADRMYQRSVEKFLNTLELDGIGLPTICPCSTAVFIVRHDHRIHVD